MLLYTLRQLEYAVAIADCGSVAGAAERLRVAQPSVSAAVMKLEDQLGLQIFLRHHAQGVTPTTAGQRFITAARRLLAQAQDIQRDAESASADVTGHLTLGCFVTIAPVFVPRLFAGFRKLHPHAELKLQEGIQDDLIAGLRTGRFDLALLYRLDIPEDLASLRQKFRWVLKRLEFTQVQQSVWMTDRDYREILVETINELGLNECVELYEALKLKV
jgi:DNA-binding transcriptional LysR family regulator